MPRMYFAHPMVDYDTPIEARALGSLLRHFPDYVIVNPNRKEHQDGFAKQGFAFEYWTDLAGSCEAIAFLPLPGGWIPSGVGAEVKTHFCRVNKLVCFEIDRATGGCKTADKWSALQVRLLGIDETRRWTHVCLDLKEGK